MKTQEKYCIRAEFKENLVKEDWEKIKPFLLAEKPMEDFAAFEVVAATNWVDGHGTRWKPDFLQVLSDTLVGKPYLVQHDKWDRNITYGRIYESVVEQITREQALELINPGESQKEYFDFHLNIAQKRDGGLYIVKAKPYLLKTIDSELVEKLEAGIINQHSISFVPPSADEEVFDEDSGAFLFTEYAATGSRKGEAVELSAVWRGSQKGAVATRNENLKTNDQNIEDKIMPKIKVNIPELDIQDRVLDPTESEELTQFQNDVSAAVGSIKAENGKLKQRAESAEKVVENLNEANDGKALTVDRVSALRETETKARSFMVDDIMTIKESLGLKDDSTKAILKRGLESSSFDDLVTAHQEARSEYAEKFPTKTQTEQRNSDGEEQEGEKEVMVLRGRSALQKK